MTMSLAASCCNSFMPQALGGSGSCIVIKIAGMLYGVAKEVEAIIVKTSFMAGLLLDELGLVLINLQQREKKGVFNCRASCCLVPEVDGP